MENVAYKPYEGRTPDYQYQNTIKLILEQGVRSKSQPGTDTLTVLCPPASHYRLDNGFPMITERSVKSFWGQPIGEICAFVNGVRTLKGLEEFGCKFWSLWGTPEKCAKRGLEAGDLGPGSYGAGFHDFPTADGGTFNQFQHIIEQIKEIPHLKTHFVSPWIPQFIGRGKGKQQKVVVAPCHGWLYFKVYGDELTTVMVQRSADFPVGVPSNMIQYAALTMMMAHATGLKPVEFIHQPIDAHVYVDQIPRMKELIKREPRPFPTVTMNTDVDDFFGFRKKHFTLGDDYNPHPAMKDIPVAI
ncbi:thymidylate synthase [Candidatus Campbellbacteria bacterium RIFOXYC2_FULL_35_25]|uniref:Thymidylate synthase n=1 Tax=Candidatus Campbellbacteria bacterium RIFOXYC2_FULL_35_25 TaxID=1797582 RepID=A0A1F5EIM7_9BACT|nr:MAG: thymidylate synthase [Candidatus Campbellbacteria bacterium RIFOXYC2_FULL_35_25]